MCARCKERPQAENHTWCATCKAAYNRERAALTRELAEARAYAEGADAMRGLLVEKLQMASPGALMQVGEVAAWIAQYPKPTRADDAT